MDGVGFNNNFSLFLMLIVTMILISVNTLEIINLKNIWQKSMSLASFDYFEKCMKYSFILKAFFVFYSLCATFSIFLLTFALVINANFFIRKFSKSFVDFNYYVFGPGMVIPGILAFCNFDKFIYTCEIRLRINMVFNVSNAFSIFLCFLIGLVIWISKALYDTFELFSNSMTRHPEGSSVIRNTFWWSVMKIGRTNNNLQNINNDHENLVNNNNPNRIIINENYINFENERDNQNLSNVNNDLSRIPYQNIIEDLENNLRAVNTNNVSQGQEGLGASLFNEEEMQNYNRHLILERNLEYLNSLRNEKATKIKERDNYLKDEEEIDKKNEGEILFRDNLDLNTTQFNNINGSNILDKTLNNIEINEEEQTRNPQ